MTPRIHSPSPLQSLAFTVAIQAIAFSLGLALELADGFWFITHLAVAIILSVFLRLPRVWTVAQVLFVSVFWIPFDPLLGLVALPVAILLGLLFVPALLGHVPYFPSKSTVTDALAKELVDGSTLHFIDLGCGFSGTILSLAARFPNGHFTGIEISPLAFAISSLRARCARQKNVRIRYQNLWDVSLKEYSVIYAFLSPKVMDRIWKKVQNEVQPGSLFISNSFPAPADEEAQIAIPNTGQTLLVYRR